MDIHLGWWVLPLAITCVAFIASRAAIADKHRARTAEHHPDVELPDKVSQGYGNAALNISTEIRAAIGATK